MWIWSTYGLDNEQQNLKLPSKTETQTDIWKKKKKKVILLTNINIFSLLYHLT